jgi:glycosyltransferase involved in cell wall biosynthesis
MKTNIAVFMEVFNEEARIENCCEFFKWADELVIIDKSSTDRTVELARKYTDKVFVVPYANSSVVANHVLPGYKTNCEWFLFPTASSAIEPKLVQELIKLTTLESFPFDVISLPLRMHILGLASDYSPWGAKFKNICIRKTALILSTEVHKEIGYQGDNVYKKLLGLDSYLLHLTHGNVDTLLERHQRYTKQEAKASFERVDLNLRFEFNALIKAFAYVVIKKRVFMMGWDGIALGLAYLSYFMMRFLYSWERLRGLDSGTYSQEIAKLKKMWGKDVA